MIMCEHRWIDITTHANNDDRIFLRVNCRAQRIETHALAASVQALINPQTDQDLSTHPPK